MNVSKVDARYELAFLALLIVLGCVPLQEGRTGIPEGGRAPVVVTPEDLWPDRDRWAEERARERELQRMLRAHEAKEI